MILLGITSVIMLAALVAGNYLDLIEMRQQQANNTQADL